MHPPSVGHNRFQERRRLQPAVERGQDAPGQRGGCGVAQREKVLEQGGLVRLAQVGLAEQEVVTVVVLVPQRLSAHHQGAQRRGDQQEREAVHRRTVRLFAESLGVLVRRVADFP